MSVSVDVWHQLSQRVHDWARKNDPEDLNYGTPYSYWREALDAGFITKDEFEMGRAKYAGLWMYRGD